MPNWNAMLVEWGAGRIMAELLIMPYFYHYLYHYHYRDIHGVLGNWRRARYAMHCSVLYCMEDDDDDDADECRPTPYQTYSFHKTQKRRTLHVGTNAYAQPYIHVGPDKPIQVHVGPGPHRSI